MKSLTTTAGIVFAGLLLMLVTTSSEVEARRQLRTYTINLDLKPEERYKVLFTLVRVQYNIHRLET